LVHGRTLSGALVVTDLDGTLLRSDTRLSPFTTAALNRLIGRGMRFTFATSRSPDKALSLLKGLDLQHPAVCLNGAVVLDPLTAQWLSDSRMERSLVARLIEAGNTNGVPPFLLGENLGQDTLRYRVDGSNPFQQAFLAKLAGEPRLQPVRELHPLDKTLSVMFVDSHTRLQRLDDVLQRCFAGAAARCLMGNVYHEGGATLAVARADVDKVHGIEILCRRLGIDRKDVVVFGDHLNDLPMFGWAGTSVAVANAVPEVKRVATAHCASNDEDGVARYLCALCGLDG
jgi:5-amino-6-(5-phospho-D-ribitylamino)uracil phosphatase